jgi:hypothetical protein
MQLNTCLTIVLRLRIYGTVPPASHTSSGVAQRKLQLHKFYQHQYFILCICSFKFVYIWKMSHCSNYAMGWTTMFVSQHHIHSSCGAHVASYPLGIRITLVRIKWLGHKPHHSLPSSLEIKTVWSYTSTSQDIPMVWCLIRHKENFI